jgi:hypothetical protein
VTAKFPFSSRAKAIDDIERLDAGRLRGRFDRPPTRRSSDEFAFRALSNIQIYEFSGARNPGIGERLELAMALSRGGEVKSVRIDSHTGDETCWLHGDGSCLSRRDVGVAISP